MSNLLGGVSKQATPLRAPNQLEAMENCVADAKTGLTRRPGSELVKVLDDVFSSPSSQFIQRGTTERYSILIENGQIVVLDLFTGNKGTVVDKTTDGARYLKTNNPSQDLKLVSVNDHTFILNKSIVPRAVPKRYKDTDIFTAKVSFNQGVDTFKFGILLSRAAPVIGVSGVYSSLAEFDAGGGSYWDYVFKYFNTHAELKDYLINTYIPSFGLFSGGIPEIPEGEYVSSRYPGINWNSTPYRSATEAEIITYSANWRGISDMPTAKDDPAYAYYKLPITNTVRTQYPGPTVKSEYSINVRTPSYPLGLRCLFDVYLVNSNENARYLGPGNPGNPALVYYKDHPTAEGLENAVAQKVDHALVINGITVEDDFTVDITNKPAYFKAQIDAHPTLSTMVDTAVVSGKLEITNKTNKDLRVYSLYRYFADIEYILTEPNKRLIVNVKNGVAQVSYRLSVNGNLAEYTTGDTNAWATWKPENIATELANDINAWGGAYTATVYGSVILVTLPAGTNTFACDDTWNNQALMATIDNFPVESDKPLRFVEGYVCSVGDPKDGYYVNYVQSVVDTNRTGGSLEYQLGDANKVIKFGQLFPGNIVSVPHSTWKAIEGQKSPYWQETYKPYEVMSLDPSTMPHVLRSLGDNQFELIPAVWQSRKVGDSLSSPMPSFVNKPLQDMFFYKQRLGFITEDTVVLSRTGSYFDFFRGTAKQVLDDDPIDAQVQMTRVSKLRQAVTFANSVVLFSDNAQFELASESVLKPTSVTILPTSNYSYNSLMPCAHTGRSVFFSSLKSGYLEVWEFEYGGTSGFSATDVGLHVNGYLPEDLNLSAASQSERMLVLAKQGGSELYVFQWLTQGQETLINAWSKWTIRGQVLAISFIEGKLYLLEKINGKVLLQTLNMEQREDQGTGLDFPVKLDYLEKDVVIANVGDSFLSKVGTQPYTFVSKATGLVVAPTSTFEDAYYLPVGEYVAGVKFTSLATLSTLYATDTRGNADVSAIVLLKAIEVKFENTADFQVLVKPVARSEKVNRYKPFVDKMHSGFVRTYITTSNKNSTITLKSDSVYPFEFQAISTEADITIRTARA